MNTTAPTRTELITILLQNYEDVLNGLRDRKGDGEHLPLMCAAWNHPAYQQLERQLRRLKLEKPHLYRHLAGTYLHPEHQRTMTCPRCKASYRPWKYPSLHSHGRRAVALVPTITRRIHPTINATLAQEGVAWIAQHWHGHIELPTELRHLAA